MNLFTIIVFAFVGVNFVTGEKYVVNFKEDVKEVLPGINLAYTEKECVNLPSEWLNRTGKVTTYGRCIRVYTQPDCTGQPTYLPRGYTDYPHVFSLRPFNLVNRIASFKKCERNLRFNLGARTRYIMTIYDDIFQNGNSHGIQMTSGECHTLPKEWQNRTRSVDLPYWPCFILYDSNRCNGKKKLFHKFYEGYELYSLDTVSFDKVAKSAKTCELEFRGKCNPVTCPKYLYGNSSEYKFWKAFFTIYSPQYGNQFEERVKKSNDGFISWDFLFSPNKSASSRGDQYADSFQIMHYILFTLIESEPGKLGFEAENIITLENLAKTVYEERYEPKKTYVEDFENENYVVMRQMEALWWKTIKILSILDSIWNNAAEKLHGEQHEVTFWDNPMVNSANTKLFYEGDECVNLQPTWQNRVSSVSIHEYCIQVYTKLDCQGSLIYLHRGYRDYQHLGVLNDKIASFKKCAPHLKFKLDARPRYSMAVYSNVSIELQNTPGYVVDVISGECHTLPVEWQNRGRAVAITGWPCFAVYNGTGCTGQKTHVNPKSPYDGRFQDYHEGFEIKSTKTCGLEFHGECKPVKCPKYLTRSTAEYTFWRYYFSTYWRPYRNQFEERVKKSSDGLISWDFLFGRNISASSRGDQYSDAFENLYSVLFTLVEGQPGTQGFNTEHIDTMSDLARTILEERREQSKMYTEDWSDHNYVVVRHMEELWTNTDTILDKIGRYWNPDKENDICGVVEPRQSLLQSTPLLSGADEAFYGEDPWHAAIYKSKSKTLICGATIISPSVLVSAAHCFFSESLNRAVNDTSEYEIYVAKFTRTYSTRDGDGKQQKIHKIKQLIFNPNGYDPIKTMSYGSDIILIILEKPLKFNKFIRPACVDWDGSVFQDSFDSENHTGRVVGWGLTTNGGIADTRDASEYLMVAKLRYISYSNCVGRVNHITSDKFCGGDDTGPAVQPGDSGGGFMFKSGGRYYIRGIVSIKDEDSDTSIGGFTNLALYIPWIQKFV